jgi:hypothetical protein
VKQLSRPVNIFVVGTLTLLLATVTGCSNGSTSNGSAPSNSAPATGNHFESDNPNDSTFTDDAGNEMQVGQDLPLPEDWPAAIPIPEGRLVAVSIVDESTAVATWQVDGELTSIDSAYLQLLESRGFTTERSNDLSTESITVFFAVGNNFDITVSATPGEKETDPGEITVLVNPSF